MLTLETGGQKMPQNFLQSTWKTEYEKSNKIRNQNILAILKTFLNVQKKSWSSTTSEFVGKISNRKKISNERFNLRETEISLDQITKSINSVTNNKPSGNDGLTAEFYRHFSNELSPVLLGVYDSWGKLDTMGLSYGKGIISAIRAVSSTNYFRKTGGPPKWEVPK